MRTVFVLSLCVLLAAILCATGGFAKDVPGKFAGYKFMEAPVEPSNPPEIGESMFQAVAASTVVLGWWQFDNHGLPDKQGWTEHDMTEQLATYFHVAGSAVGCDTITPIAGTKSMWCGKWPTSAEPWCGWVALPGYGNSWDQSLEAHNVSTLSYTIAWDTEAGYDYVYLEWWEPVDHFWTEDATVNGGQGSYDGSGSRFENVTSPYGSTKVRIHFVSDRMWSDEDGDAPTAEGAVKVDGLSINGGAVEDWEEEACNATQSTDGTWVAQVTSGFGLYAKLVHGSNVVQEDPCFRQQSYLWGFFDNPAITNYACGGWPFQGALHHGPDENGLYLSNEIWSPWIPITGTGNSFLLQYLVYRDLPLDNLVFYTSHVRTRDAAMGNCPTPTPWRTMDFVYYGEQKDWYRQQIDIGPFVNVTEADDIQISLGAIDMCGIWCGVMSEPPCHSHAPLFDQVRLVRANVAGPQWVVRDIDLWQDNFPEEGGVAPGSFARCDMAQDILKRTDPNILPGDSMKVAVIDPAGLAVDNTGGRPGKAVYVFTKVTDRFGTPIAGKDGLAIQSPDNRAYATDPNTGSLRWPHVAGLAPTGWDAYRMDKTYYKTGTTWKELMDAFCCDLMDLGSGPTGPHYKHANENVALNTGIFEPGDVIHYILAAKNTNNEWSYMYRTFNGQGSWVLTNNFTEALTSPCEWSVLPDRGRLPGDMGDILYVDDADDRGGPAQLFFDWSFKYLNIENRVDRFDVLGPSSCIGNSLASRVKNYAQQVVGDPTEIYQIVLWNCSDLSRGLMGDGGDANGGSSGEKSNDFGLCNSFLTNHPNNPGWAYWGDDVAQDWVYLAGAGAVAVKSTYMTHQLVKGDHKTVGEPISPLVTQNPGSPIGPATLIAFGGCPAINDFDVVSPTGTTLQAMQYTNPANRAVLIKATPNAAGTTARFVLSGFGYNFIRDDAPGDPPDYVLHLRDILTWFENILPDPIGINPVAFSNNLENAYPNPFNPTTTVKYSIASSGHVSLKIYNAAGQLVRTLVDEEQAPRAEGFAVTWDGTNSHGQPAASGVYFYKLATEEFSQTKKMAVLK